MAAPSRRSEFRAGERLAAFEALTGRRPFQAARLTDFEKLHLGGSFPPALGRMFQRALAKRPEDRFATALELADALRAPSSGCEQPRGSYDPGRSSTERPALPCPRSLARSR